MGRGASGPSRRDDLVPLLFLFVLASALLFVNLGRPYLWQDEAATAVMGERLVREGKPLAYDGKNVITMDSFADEDTVTIGGRTSDAATALTYLVARRDFRDDYSWIGQPWGQFLVAGVSLAIFGHDTLPARLPFACAGLLTVLLLYRFARALSFGRTAATVAALFLAGNVYWILHARQCRYYALSGLFLLLTAMAWNRWMRGAPRGALLFVLTAWCWFQLDFGTFWPVIGLLLGAGALLAREERGSAATSASATPGTSATPGASATPGTSATPGASAAPGTSATPGASAAPNPSAEPTASATRRPSPSGVVITGVVLLAAVAPFVFYYGLFARVRTTVVPFEAKLLGNFFHLNQFSIPFLLFLGSAWLYARKRASLPAVSRALLGGTIWLVPILVVWVSIAGPWYFHRYLVPATPLFALLAGWTVVESCRAVVAWRSERGEATRITSVASFAVALSLLVTPAASNPVSWILPASDLSPHPLGTWLRPELRILGTELFGHRVDPNRAVIEWIRERARPDDEILVTYEDVPFQFYLPENRVRGGVACFRVEDPRTAPRFLVVRQSVPFLHWPVFQREIGRHAWERADLVAPDVPFGNNPDPDSQPAWYGEVRSLVVAERRGARP